MSLSIAGGFDSSQLASHLFAKIDSNSQGYIDKTELQQAFSDISGTSDSTSSDELFSKLDSDGNGQITESEFSSGLDTLTQALFGQLQQAQFGAMPPPPDDEGLTQEQLSSIAGNSSVESGAQDKLSALLQNFDTADTNQDGKVSAQEAMAFDQSQNSGSEAIADTDGSAMADQSQLMAQLLQLLRSYGGDGSDASNSGTVSASA